MKRLVDKYMVSDALIINDKSSKDAMEARRFAHVVYMKHALNKMTTDKALKQIFESIAT